MAHLLSVEEARKDLSLSKSKFYELLASGEIESLKIGRSRRIPADAIERFIARRLLGDAA